MATITPGAVFGTNAPFNVSPAYSGTFIPSLWSARLNAKFYAASVFAAITNTDWEGEISGLGDKVIINNIPDVTISDYQIGTPLNYQVPTPNTLELLIDKGKSFNFQVSDVIAYQSKLDMMDVFSNDASEQMKVSVDKQVITGTFSNGSSANKGATAGVKSGAFNMGTDTAPVALTAANVLQKILEMASVLDEQNVPETDRFCVIDPLTRTLLLQSNIAQAQFMGDSTSPVRNGLIGRIDRFDIYVSNQLPVASAGLSFPDIYGATTSVGGALKRRAIIAGHRSSMCFASQMTKTETLRNPTDFGDLVRGLQVYGYKVVKPEALALLIAQ